MNLTLGLRALLLLTFVAASTVMIVTPELIVGAGAGKTPALNAVVALSPA